MLWTYFFVVLMQVLSRLTSSTAAVSMSDFYTPYRIENNWYAISKSALPIVEARSACVEIGMKLAFFRTNEEYWNVSKIPFALSIPLVRNHRMWTEIAVTHDGTAAKFSWADEELDVDVWGPSQPNGKCTGLTPSNLDKCCVQMRFKETFDGLFDVDNLCTEVLRYYICKDINECEESIDDCEQVCVNRFQDSYVCQCHKGYVLQQDKKSCVDVDECTARSTCRHVCSTDNVGALTCTCQETYDTVGSLCVDGHQCFGDSRFVCPKNAECINTIGSFYCQCASGYILQDNQCISERPQPEVRVIPNLCSCPCSRSTVRVPRTPKEVEESVQAIQKELFVATKVLSSHVRRKTSALDRRSSAQVTGQMGIVLMSLVAALIIVPDLIHVIFFFKTWLCTPSSTTCSGIFHNKIRSVIIEGDKNGEVGDTSEYDLDTNV